MSQIALPISDVSVTGWTPTPVWSQVNLPVPDDVHLVTAGIGPTAASFKVNLTHLARPDGGAQALTVRMKQTGMPATSASVILWQGTKPITGASFALMTSFTNCTISLSAAEIARITDYANLQVQVITPVTVLCCPNMLPAVLHATLSAAASCACVAGSYPIVYGLNPFGLGEGWAFSGTACNGNNFFIFLQCSAAGWNLYLSCGPGGFGSPLNSNPNFLADASSTCGPPIHLTWTPYGGLGGVCCAFVQEMFNITVTV